MQTTKLIQISTALILTSLLSGCGPSIPRTELHDLPPLIEIVALDFNSKQLKARITHRNKNTRENNQLSCQLALKDFEAIRFDSITVPNLTTYAKETVNIDLSDSQFPQLNQLSKELPYVLDCFLFSENFRKEQVIKKATLFQVPGSEYEFR